MRFGPALGGYHHRMIPFAFIGTAFIVVIVIIVLAVIGAFSLLARLGRRT